MASSYKEWTNTGCGWPGACGGNCQRHVSYINVDLSGFSHVSSNASLARITFSCNGYYGMIFTIWANQNTGIAAIESAGYVIATSVYIGYGIVYRWTGCNYGWKLANWSSNWSYNIDSSENNKSFGFGTVGKWSGSDYSYGFNPAIVNISLPTNYQLLPPYGMSISNRSSTDSTISTRTTISSWSRNSNIGGNVYTSGGGRDWNWRAEVYKNGSYVMSREKNTYGSRSADWYFSGLEPGTTYRIEYTASNEFQLTEEDYWTETTTIRPPSIYILDIKGSRANIRISPSTSSASTYYSIKKDSTGEIVKSGSTYGDISFWVEGLRPNTRYEVEAHTGSSIAQFEYFTTKKEPKVQIVEIKNKTRDYVELTFKVVEAEPADEVQYNIYLAKKNQPKGEWNQAFGYENITDKSQQTKAFYSKVAFNPGTRIKAGEKYYIRSDLAYEGEWYSQNIGTIEFPAVRRIKPDGSIIDYKLWRIYQDGRKRRISPHIINGEK